MNTRPARVPNANVLERLIRTKSVRVMAAGDETARKVLADFDQQVEALASRDDQSRKPEPN